MSQLADLRAAVVATIKGWLPDLRACEPHAGRFNLDELKRLGVQAPAVRVAVIGGDRALDLGNGEIDLPLRLAAFVVTADRRGLPKDEAAMAIVETLVKRVPHHRWGLPWAHPARADVQPENLHSTGLAGQGIALWAVGWTQALRLGEDIFAGDGVLPAKVYLGQAPLTGAANEEDYDLVVGGEE